MKKIPLILTRPEGSNSAFAADFPKPLASRFDFIDCPLLRVEPLRQIEAIPPEAAALFTSVNGVRHAPLCPGQNAYCVGQRTTQAALAAGWEAICLGQNAEELVAALLQLRPSEPLFHLSGTHVRGRIVEQLAAAGLTAQRVALYDQVLLPLSASAHLVLEAGNPVVVPLFSPRTAAHFVAVAPGTSRVFVVALSEAVARNVGTDPRFDVVSAAEPTVDAVISLIEKLADRISLG